MQRTLLLSSLILALVSCSTTSTTPPPLTAQGLNAPHGLLGKYFKLNAGGTSVFDHLQIDQHLNRTWGKNESTSSTTWNARLTAPAAGTYTFHLTTSGYTELTMNSQQVAAYAGDQATEVAGTWEFTRPGETVDLVVKHSNAGQLPNQLRLEWTDPNGRRQVIPSRYLTPVDLTADCQKQPAQGCLAKFQIPPYVSGVTAMAPATINASFSVDNLSDLYPLRIKVHSTDFPAANGEHVVEPNSYVPIGFTFTCESAAYKEGTVTVTRVQDGQTMDAAFTFSCMGVAFPSQP